MNLTINGSSTRRVRAVNILYPAKVLYILCAGTALVPVIKSKACDQRYVWLLPEKSTNDILTWVLNEYSVHFCFPSSINYFFNWNLWVPFFVIVCSLKILLLPLFQGTWIIISLTMFPSSTGFGWDGVDFLHSSPSSPMFWICVQNSANMEVF